MTEFLVLAGLTALSLVIPIVLGLLMLAFSIGICKKSVLLFAAIVVFFALFASVAFDFESIEDFNAFGFVYCLFGLILLNVL